jgi:hypothetical protein
MTPWRASVRWWWSDGCAGGDGALSALDVHLCSGVYKYASGDSYKGMFKGNEALTVGCSLFAWLFVAHGGEADNKFHGFGCYTFAANGSKIEGSACNLVPTSTLSIRL